MFIRHSPANNTSNTDEYCYLGITVDSCLTWEKYIVKLCNKISPIVANLQHLRHFLTNEQINTLYFSYIQPHIDYGLTIWGHCANRLILKVQRFQNRCARIEFIESGSVSHRLLAT